MKNLCILLLSVFLASCASKEAPHVVDFPREISVNEYDSLPINLLNPAQIFVSDKYIAVLVRHEDKMIWVYDTQSHEHIASFVALGRGPNEVLQLNRIGQTDMSGGNLKLKVQSFPEFIAWLDIDASIRENKTVFTDKVEFDGRQSRSSNMLYAANGVYYLNDSSKFLMFMDPDRSGNFQYNPSPFSLIFDLEGRDISDTLYWYSHPQPRAPMILFSSMAGMSHNRKYLGRANRYINSIVIGNIEENRVKTIGFDSRATDLRKAEQEKATYFDEASANNDYFFAIRHTASETSSEIWVVDWDGEPVAKIHVPLKLRAMCVTDRNQIYAITNEDRIVMFDSGL